MPLDGLVDEKPSTPQDERAFEIHFDEHGIDHPLAELRWCFSPAALKFMRAHPDYEWGAVIVAQPKNGERDGMEPDYQSFGNRQKETRLVVTGLEKLKMAKDYFDFLEPGEYDVVGYLFYQENSWETGHFLKKLKELDDKTNRLKGLMLDDGSIRTEHLSDMLGGAKVLGTSHIVASVPPEIFPKPTPKWLVKYFKALGLQPPKDECDRRGKTFLAIFILPPVFLVFGVLYNVVVRTWALIMGVFHFLFGGNPFPVWRHAVEWTSMPTVDGFWGQDDYEGLKIFAGPLGWFRPISLLIIGSLFWLGANYNLAPLIVTAVAMTLALAAFMFWSVSDTEEKRAARQERARKAESEKLFAELEQYAVCDLTHMPKKGPRTKQFIWTGVKRSLCRPYRQNETV
ncbi:MAG: hypothetical protein ABA06_03525 [Parcubacteria bacterium C7867-001]|nr:MAG: hypothetical protein ABA06_03525 [Parcubacteria bacterium C7867-001]